MVLKRFIQEYVFEYPHLAIVCELLDRYIALAKEARAPLLPAIVEIKNSLPDLAMDYFRIKKLRESTSSKLKALHCKHEMDEILRRVADTVDFIKDELLRLEVDHQDLLYNDLRVHLDPMQGHEIYSSRLARAKEESNALLQIEGSLKKT